MFDYQRLRSIELKNLVRHDLGSNLNFAEILPDLEKIKEYLLFFENKENFLTNLDKESIINIYDELSESVSSIQSFRINSSESHEQAQIRRSAIIVKVRILHKTSNEKILPLLVYLKFNDVKIEDNILNIQSKINNFDNQFVSKLKNFDNDVKNKLTDFDNIIDNARNRISEAEKIKNDLKNFSVENLVKRYGDIFSKQADKNINIAIVGLIVFIVSILILIVLTYKFFNPLIQELININGTKIAIEYILTAIIFRLTILGIAFVIVKESLKSFNVNMHLYNINKHRQNSLLSFESLISNIHSSNTRDLIIEEIARTIYANQDDGYLHVDRKSLDPSQIIDLIKTVKN